MGYHQMNESSSDGDRVAESDPSGISGAGVKRQKVKEDLFARRSNC